MIEVGKIFKNISYVIYLVLFGIVVIGTLGLYTATQPLSLVMGVVLFFISIVGYMIIKKSKYRISNKMFFIILMVMLLVMIIIQVYVAWELKMRPQNDRLVIFRQALNMISRNSLHTAPRWNRYFLKYPNNQVFLLIETGYLYIVKALGFGKHYVMSLSILNILCIDSAIVITVMLCKKMWNKRTAMMLAVFCFVFLPFYLYVPFFYTDTFVLPIVAGILYLYYSLWKSDKLLTTKPILTVIVLGLLLALGYMVKASVIILFVAIIIHMCYRKKIREVILCMGMIMMVIIVGVGIPNKIIAKMEVFDTTDYNVANFPFTHWVMMGLNGVGKYEKSEKEFTDSFTTKEDKSKANIKVIKERLKKYGNKGLIKHLAEKAAYTWYSGEYDMGYYLRYEQKNKNFLMTLVDNREENYIVVEMYSNGIHICMLFAIFYAGLCGFRKKDQGFQWFIKLGILGLFTFLLIWETRPRYLVQYLPLILLTATQGWIFIMEKVEKQKLGKLISKITVKN